MKKVILWGMGNRYEESLNLIRFEILKGNIDVVGVVVKRTERYCKIKDGFRVITKEELELYEYDYIVVTAELKYSEIRDEAVEMGCAIEKIISINVFRIPYFDFDKLTQLIENPVTILSDDCWGGMIYNKLGLVASSPTVNTLFLSKSDYFKFIQKPFYYLDSKLSELKDGNLCNTAAPIGYLGDGDEKVVIRFPHTVSFKNAKEQWERRIKRINKNNIFVKVGISGRDMDNGISESIIKEYSDVFQKLPYKKIFICPFKDVPHSFCSPLFSYFISNDSGFVSTFDINEYGRQYLFRDFDILNMLVNGMNSSRYGTII